MDVNRRVLIIDNDFDFVFAAVLALLQQRHPVWGIHIAGDDDPGLRSPDISNLTFMARSNVPLRSDRQSGRITRSLNAITIGRSRSLARVVVAVREFEPELVVLDHFFGEVGFSGIDIAHGARLQRASLIGTCTTEAQPYCDRLFGQKRECAEAVEVSMKNFLLMCMT